MQGIADRVKKTLDLRCRAQWIENAARNDKIQLNGNGAKCGMHILPHIQRQKKRPLLLTAIEYVEVIILGRIFDRYRRVFGPQHPANTVQDTTHTLSQHDKPLPRKIPQRQPLPPGKRVALRRTDTQLICSDIENLQKLRIIRNIAGADLHIKVPAKRMIDAIQRLYRIHKRNDPNRAIRSFRKRIPKIEERLAWIEQ